MEPPPEWTSSSGTWKAERGQARAPSCSMPLERARHVRVQQRANVVRSNSRITGCSAAPETSDRSGNASRDRVHRLVLVRGIEERPQERDGDRLDALVVDQAAAARQRRPRDRAGRRRRRGGRSVRRPRRSRRGSTICGRWRQPAILVVRPGVPRANGTSSSNPSVVTSNPTRRPAREASMLVTAVVPSPNRRTGAGATASACPARSAASSAGGEHPVARRARAWSATWPARSALPSLSTASVKVPPTSTPKQTSPVPRRRRAVGR